MASSAGDVRTAAPEDRSVRRARSRRARQQSPLERYRTWIITGVAAVGVLIIGFVFFSGATTSAYTCQTLLTPGPVESLTPRPSILATPTPVPTASPAPTAGASSSAAASGTPSASATPAASGSPAASGTPSTSGSPAVSPTAQPSPTPEPTARLGFTTPILGNTHTNGPVNYAFCPPTSGDHIPAPPRGPIPAQFYPPNEQRAPNGWVHNLEHGYVALLYRCPGGAAGADGCPTQAELDQMRAWFDQAPPPTIAACPKKVLVARFDDMSTRFALVAWGRAYLFDEFNLDNALLFAQQWIEHDAAPENNSC